MNQFSAVVFNMLYNWVNTVFCSRSVPDSRMMSRSFTECAPRRKALHLGLAGWHQGHSHEYKKIA